jgi:hypothetical protein
MVCTVHEHHQATLEAKSLKEHEPKMVELNIKIR